MDRKDYYHCAKLSLFNVRLLHDLQTARSEQSSVEQIIQERAAKDMVKGDVSLKHQSTFLGHAYIILVWLNEYVYKKFDEPEAKAFKCWFSKAFDIKRDTSELKSELLKSPNPRGRSPRDLLSRHEFFRTIRNALAHARVDIQEDLWVFDNTSEYDRAVVKMTWDQFGLLTHATMMAYTKVLYPETAE